MFKYFNRFTLMVTLSVIFSSTSLCLSNGIIKIPSKSHIIWHEKINQHYKVPKDSSGISVSDYWGYDLVVFYTYANQNSQYLNRVTLLGGDVENMPEHRLSFTIGEIESEDWDLWKKRYVQVHSIVNEDNHYQVQWKL